MLFEFPLNCLELTFHSNISLFWQQNSDLWYMLEGDSQTSPQHPFVLFSFLARTQYLYRCLGNILMNPNWGSAPKGMAVRGLPFILGSRWASVLYWAGRTRGTQTPVPVLGQGQPFTSQSPLIQADSGRGPGNRCKANRLFLAIYHIGTTIISTFLNFKYGTK